MTAPHQTADRPATPAPGAENGADTLRAALRRLASGVTVITVPGPAGFTATSFTSVSVSPPLVSFYVSATASTAPAVRRAGHFAAHILTDRQADVAARFARSGADRFAGTRWQADGRGVPLLHGVDAWLTARTTEIRPVGDHLLVVGEVVEGGGPGDRSPLVHHAGALTGLTGLPPAQG